MGLLKHVVLPMNALLNIGFFFKLLIAEDYDDLQSLWVDTPLSPMEHHLWHCLGGSAICNLLHCIVAFFAGNKSYRVMVCAMHALLFAVDGWSYIHFGKDVPPVLYFIVGINILGLLVHLKEPGLFTKDKNAGGKKEN